MILAIHNQEDIIPPHRTKALTMQKSLKCSILLVTISVEFREIAHELSYSYA